MADEIIIPRALIDAYGAALSQLEDATAAQVTASVARWMELRPDADFDELREAITSIVHAAAIEGASQAEGVSGAISQAMADDLGVPLRQTADSVAHYDGIKHESILGTVRRQINLLREGKRSEFATAMGRLASKHVKPAARAMSIGAGKSRYQRLQQGERTCTFCQMLASRGPIFLSAASAGQFRKFHAGCDCVVIEVPVGCRVEGFDQRHEQRKYSAFAAIDADHERYPTREARDAAKMAWTDPQR